MFYADNYTFDDDLKGVTLDIYAYGYLTSSEFESLEIGDIIEIEYIEGQDPVQIEVDQFSEYKNIIKISENEWRLVKQADGRYFIDDGVDGKSRIKVGEQVHFDLDLKTIEDGTYVYGGEEPVRDEYAVVYGSLAEFIDDLNCDSAFSVPDLHIVCDNNTITEMYINPALHEGWIER